MDSHVTQHRVAHRRKTVKLTITYNKSPFKSASNFASNRASSQNPFCHFAALRLQLNPLKGIITEYCTLCTLYFLF
ncbi:hypothetical protein M378DRAFT_172162 [Amanita muscaria Koide BX008]|uniref:Uncharacterized protein n=1 Tax=Amanita muscaria (strain Koide BX008) TaxID=946122 RepID=A0A0C2WLJ1_AMAMK|nr:hypothetical protein M378DRAFT_172162 [Amanita muscaria Koide BX008]